MKMINQLTVLFVVVLLSTSCKKDAAETKRIASLTLGNYVAGGTTVKLGSRIQTVSNNGSAQLALFVGENDLYAWPINDSLNPYFTRSKFNAEDRAVYSLFLCGTPAMPEGIIIKETIPYRTDSTAGIRFINLSPNSTALSITRSTSPTVNEVTGLGFKSYTDYISYPGFYNSAYTFQIRNAAGALLTSFSFSASSIPRFANVTLVIRGMVGASPALGVTRVNQDR
ncbi:MAG: hypothetical protein ABI675_25525 [Chitinophagaceae bacterium]